MTTPIKPVFSDKEILARTLYGEARGEGQLGIDAVASVIMNRVKNPCWWGKSVRTVCLKPWQFSCWNEKDPNRDIIINVTDKEPIFRLCLLTAELAIEGLVTDPTYGADSYHDIRMTVPPKWVANATSTTVINHHIFYITRK